MEAKQLEGTITDTTLVIGTCRVKRPRAFLEKATREHLRLVRSHVHYPAEILQMIRYLKYETEIADSFLPLVIDDVNNGNLFSLEAAEERREATSREFGNARNFIIEVCSLKRISFPGLENETLFANITSLSNLSKSRCKADFVDLGEALELAQNCKYEQYTESSFQEDMSAIIESLDGRSVTLVSHVQANIPSTGEPIAERIKVAHWLEEAAIRHGCDFYDPTDIVNNLGESVALKDTSHLTEAGERAMAVEIERIIMSHRHSNVDGAKVA